ncbi:MAG: AraC family transcriptional regulator [Alphaproteobacteria bacterium]|nr:AraC family transcriptional regulator [Alphaproteobacteria bacterium]
MDQHPGLIGPSLLRIDSRLHPTLWRLGGGDRRNRAFVLIEDGAGGFEQNEGEWRQASSPSLHWITHAAGRRFRAEAGTTGYVGTVGEAFLAQMGADYADAAILGFVAEHDHHLDLDGDTEGIIVPGLFATLFMELQGPRIGSHIIVSSHLRILLVTILRLARLDVSLEGSGSEARFLQRFRALIEANFRAHWPVGRYAERIGISPDRLHGLCTRKLGKTPRALIAERVAREAAIGLERSTLSLEQLSYALGFRDPTHFSHFFKRMTGLAPGAFRRLVAAGMRETPPITAESFADWP